VVTCVFRTVTPTGMPGVKHRQRLREQLSDESAP